MAVRFGVPASPKKSVFAIDNFLGVDLTNTGANISETQSPNAPNMVRHVPGKVRKRTGYKTMIEFSTGTDVNRAKNTSEELTEHAFDKNNELTFDIYGAPIAVFSILIFIEAVGSYTIYLDCVDEYSISANFGGTEENPYSNIRYNYKTNVTDHGGLYQIRFKKTSDGDSDYFKTQGLLVCAKVSADSYRTWLNMPWKAAPEDNGGVFFHTESDLPVYGVHSLKTGSFDGNRIIGVNRAKNTSSAWRAYSTPGADGLFRLPLYDVFPTGQKIKIQFDYRKSNAFFYFYAGINGIRKESIFDVEGASGTISTEVILPCNANEIVFGSQIFDRSIEISKFSVSYSSNNEGVVWDVAPEEMGDIFHYEDLYLLDESNQAFRTTFSASMSGSTSTSWRRLGQAFQNEYETVSGTTYLAFTVSATAMNENTPYFGAVDLFVSTHAGDKIYLEKNANNIDGKSYVVAFLANDEDYLENIEIECPTLEYRNCELTITVYSIEVNAAQFKQNYDVYSSYYLYHIGNKMYMDKRNGNAFSEISSDAGLRPSKSWQIGDCLYIVDGNNFRRFNKKNASLENVSSVGYIPTVTVAKEPSGGGIQYEPVNMLQPAFIEMFAGNDSTTYQLSFGELDATPVKAWVMNSIGDWVENTEGIDFSVYRYDGVVAFNNAPGASPIDGEDNVKIQAYRTVPDYADRINKCTIGTLFGVNGESDRLFLSGNPDRKNWDFFSEKNNPTYFPDTGYSSLGLETSAIVGYSKVNNYLATHKDEMETEQNVLVREGDLITRRVGYGEREFEYTEPAFRLINTIQGAGAIGKYTFGNLQTEPIFLTRSGLFAITSQDITGEKYGQNRSFYLNGALTKEENPENAYCAVYNDMYFLAINNKLYVLDGLQPIRTDRAEPYATRQYVGYLCTDVPANIIFTQEKALWIGTNDGKICRFATDIDALNSYSDDGKPIYCCWETPDLDGRLFYKNKTFRYFAIRMMKALRTSAKLYSLKLGAWNFIKEDTSSGMLFDFGSIDFSLFSFSTDASEKIARTKLRVKKVDKARFRVENDKLNEPFGLYDLALEYAESGNYKG